MTDAAYDNPEFFEKYSQLRRQTAGLDGAAEWPALRSLLPSVADRDVIDLGCGFGWHCRWAVQEGAAAVLGIDVSDRMLDRARAMTTSDIIRYERQDMESLALSKQSADVVFSSLALHYVKDLAGLFTDVAAALRPGGSMVFSVEHPIYSAPSRQAFEVLDDGRKIWPLEDYLVESERQVRWLGSRVAKQHRTVASYANSAIAAGFVIRQLIEWGPPPASVATQPDLAEDLHRPWFLLVGAVKAGEPMLLNPNGQGPP